MNNLNVIEFKLHHIKDVYRLFIGSILYNPILISLHILVGWGLFTLTQYSASDITKMASALGLLFYMIYLYCFSDVLLCVIMFACTTKKSTLQILSLFQGDTLKRTIRVFFILTGIIIASSVLAGVAYALWGNIGKSDTKLSSIANTVTDGVFFVVSVFVVGSMFIQRVQDTVRLPLSHISEEEATDYIVKGVSLNLMVMLQLFLGLLFLSVGLLIGTNVGTIIIPFFLLSIVTNYVTYVIYFSNSFPVKKLLDIKVHKLATTSP